MKTLHADTSTQLESGELKTAHLVEVILTNANGTDVSILMTDYNVDLTISGKTYLASGHLLGISEISTSNDLQINDVTVSLSGIDGTKISEVLSYNYIDRELHITRAFLNSSDNYYSDPVKVFVGRINSPTINENPNDGTAIVTINASSYLADFDKKPARHTNHIEHNFYYPNDDFFSLWGQIDKEIIWGYTE